LNEIGDEPAHLGERAVVPDVTVVGEAVADEAQLAALDVLLDGIEGLLLGDLHLRVGPARDLDDHVQDALGLVGEERDVVEGRDDGAILLDVDAMLCSIDKISGQVAGKNRIPRVLGAPTRRGVYSGDSQRCFWATAGGLTGGHGWRRRKKAKLL
jgi:hypothetical protein